MAIITNTWGWWAQGASTETGTGPGLNQDLNNDFNGETFTAGVNATAHGYGEMKMVDGDNDGNLHAVQRNQTPAPGNGDRFQTPDGIDRFINEIAIYNNSTYTYTDTNGDEQTYVARAVVYQLGNGDLIIRMRDDDRDAAPSDFYIDNLTSIDLGTWDEATYGNSFVSNFDEFPPNVCFTRGTLIRTDRGDLAVEDLRVDDLVMTRDAGYQPIRWIGSRIVPAPVLAARPELRPIRIQAGTLGNGAPATDLIISPQHRVLVRSAIAQRLFGTDEVLVAAKQLLLIDGIDILDDGQDVEYFHCLFDDHQVVFSNGAETESLYTGPQALKTVGPAALEEIYTLFPELRDRDPQARPEGARLMLSGRQGRKLAHRHAQHSKALVM